MMKDDQQEAYEKLLSANLSRAIDWLKYAETKNAALLAFDSAWIVAIVNIFARAGGPPAGFSLALLVAALLLLVAGVMLLWAFLPRTDLWAFFKREAVSKRNVNLAFYGDIAAEPIDSFAATIHARYYPLAGKAASDAYIDDLAVQLHVNATIAAAKFTSFRWAARFTLAALVVICIPILWHTVTTITGGNQ